MRSNDPLVRAALAHQRAREALDRVLDSLKPIAEGTPGLPAQMERLKENIDRLDKATTALQRIVATLRR